MSRRGSASSATSLGACSRPAAWSTRCSWPRTRQSTTTPEEDRDLRFARAHLKPPCPARWLRRALGGAHSRNFAITDSKKLAPCMPPVLYSGDQKHRPSMVLNQAANASFHHRG